MSVCLCSVTRVTESMIVARGLRKSFGGFEAVKGIDVDVRRGEAFGFLGPNGAGKSSTMRMIGAVSPVSGGELRILGMDPAIDGPAIRGRLGVCPQEDTLDNELNVRDNIYIYGRYFGIPKAEVAERTDELLEFVQLTEKAKSRVEDLSGGMKRRLTIARSLVNRPDLLLLDEPTTGLDPQARHVLWDRLFRLKQQGVTLVITTHYMDEAEQLCDRLVVMDKGLIVAEGSPLELIRHHSTREVAELRFGVGSEGESHDVLAEKIADLGDRVEVLPDRLLVYTADGEEVVAKVHERGLQPVAVLVRRSTLEDVFLRLTGRTLVDCRVSRRSPALAARPPEAAWASSRASAARSTTGRPSSSGPGAGPSSPPSSLRCSTSSRWASCSVASSTATRTGSKVRRPTSRSWCRG
jgi:lipooligosaccharide transport system ATP-binding protein